jgi:hypothetical protein
MRAMTEAVLMVPLVFSLSAAAMAQNISNTRDRNGNLVRRSAPINNTLPMINSTANNPARRPHNIAPTADQNLAPTADQNLSPTSDDIARMLGYRK